MAGITGAPQETARLRAETLLPRVRMVSGRADEGDPAAAQASANSGLSESRAVARVDRVGAGLLGDADHLVDGQVALQRAELAASPRPTW